MKIHVMLVALMLPVAAQAQAIRLISQADLTVTGTVDFTSLATALPGTRRDDIVVMPGASFGEHFAGMTVLQFSTGETYSGLPTAGLSLVAGPARQNLTIASEPGVGAYIAGNSAVDGGYPRQGAIGEGMVSLKFDIPQSELGFDLLGVDARLNVVALIDFWNIDGGLIGSFTRTNRMTVTELAFRRENGIADIAGITIRSVDQFGLGYNDFRLALPGVTTSPGPAVPEPASWAMLVAGFGLVGAAARRRTAAATA